MFVCRFGKWLGQYGFVLHGQNVSGQEGRLKSIGAYKTMGIWPLLFAWLPIIGDALPIAAGWLRLNALHCAIILIAGKLLRYAMIYWGNERSCQINFDGKIKAV